ncbi:MAG: hypothetical protein J6C93_07570 [Clostridia bacterium]|nr:hypothetical protein [Clostridia bacterium]
MKKLEKVFDILGEILAVLLVIVYALWILNLNFNFLPNGVVFAVSLIKEYGLLLLVVVVGLEAMSKRNLIFRIIFYLMIALIVVFLFFPDTYASLQGMINK